MTGWACETDIRDAVIELTDADGTDTPLDELARKDIFDQLNGLLTAEGVIGYAILDGAANIIVADGPQSKDWKLAPAGREIARAVVAGESLVTSPFAMGNFYERGESMPPAKFVIKTAPRCAHSARTADRRFREHIRAAGIRCRRTAGLRARGEKPAQ